MFSEKSTEILLEEDSVKNVKIYMYFTKHYKYVSVCIYMCAYIHNFLLIKSLNLCKNLTFYLKLTLQMQKYIANL